MQPKYLVMFLVFLFVATGCPSKPDTPPTDTSSTEDETPTVVPTEDAAPTGATGTADAGRD